MEDAFDAFYEGAERIIDSGPPSGPTFLCPFCASIFSDRQELQGHVSDAHSVERPALLINGSEPSRRSTIRTKVLASNIVIANTTSLVLGLNGNSPQEISVDSFVKSLSSIKQAEAKITLQNDSQINATPVSTSYDLAIRIATPNELRGVERAFADTIMSEKITRGIIGLFLEDDRTTGAGSEYAAGLAEYALGVLLKERPDTEMLTTPFSRYRDAYGTALQKLTDFERPIARLISDIIRFAMNDFSRALVKTGFWELDLAKALLKEPETKEVLLSRDIQEVRKAICPVDHGTGQILALAERMASQDRWSPILDEECRKAATSGILDATDRQKALAIWAVSAWRLGAKESATEPLRQISATYPFSKWAEPYLESMTK